MKKALFGKTSCLKVQQSESDTYIHMGRNVNGKWEWDKLKMSDVELGEIINILEGISESWSTVHVFREKQNKIWVNRKGKEVVFFKVNDTTKALSPGEQQVLKLVLQKCILDSKS